MKTATPMISRMRLVKMSSCVRRRYVTTAATAEDRSIFADDFQFTVTL